MYILKAKYMEDIVIKDLNVVVNWNDPDGVEIEDEKYFKSNDIKSVENHLVITRPVGNFSEKPDKNVIDTEDDLKNIENPIDDMITYIRNYMKSNCPALVIYQNDNWKIIASGNNVSSPLNISASMVIEDATHKFITESEKKKLDDISSFSGDYNDLKNKPTISTVSKAGQTGDYNDLTNKPIIPIVPTLSTVATSGKYTDLIGIPNLATIAMSGKYSDLIGIPALSAIAFSGDYNDLKNKPSGGTDTSTLAAVATSGDYNDLTNKPVIPTMPTLSTVATSGNYNDLINKPTIPVVPTLSTVATSGDYNDLKNKPTIPVVPTLSTVATSGKYTDLTGTPNLSTVAFSGDYNDLKNKPSGGAGTGTLATVATSGDYNDLINKPSVYTKNEIDQKISTASGAVRYEAIGSTGGDVMIIATGTGVSAVKNNNNISITVPNGITLLSIQCHFAGTEIGSSSGANIDFNSTATNSYTPGDFNMPVAQVVNDVSGSRAYRTAAAFNYNTNSHTFSVTGLLSNTAVWIKLTF